MKVGHAGTEGSKPRKFLACRLPVVRLGEKEVDWEAGGSHDREMVKPAHASLSRAKSDVSAGADARREVGNEWILKGRQPIAGHALFQDEGDPVRRIVRRGRREDGVEREGDGEGAPRRQHPHRIPRPRGRDVCLVFVPVDVFVPGLRRERPEGIEGELGGRRGRDGGEEGLAEPQETPLDRPPLFDNVVLHADAVGETLELHPLEVDAKLRHPPILAVEGADHVRELRAELVDPESLAQVASVHTLVWRLEDEAGEGVDFGRVDDDEIGLILLVEEVLAGISGAVNVLVCDRTIDCNSVTYREDNAIGFIVRCARERG